MGSRGKFQYGLLYKLLLINNLGAPCRVWGFGVDEIMGTSEPTDLSPKRSLFPHIPEAMFCAIARKPVDFLIGNNFLHLHPSGGQGENAVGSLRVMQSKFGTGWVVASTFGAYHLLLSHFFQSPCHELQSGAGRSSGKYQAHVLRSPSVLRDQERCQSELGTKYIHVPHHLPWDCDLTRQSL